MQMKIPHNLVVLVVSLGYFAQGTPTPAGACFEQVSVPVEAVTACPEPEVVSITTVYRTVKELVPEAPCTDDFTDFANVQLIADTACSNGLVFSTLTTRKRSLFERSPSCQSFSIIGKPAPGLRRRGDSGLKDAIGEKFHTLSEKYYHHNINQNINNNDNLNEDDDEEISGHGGNGGHGGRYGHSGYMVKRSPYYGGGYDGGNGGGAFDNNDNQNINQNQNANQNLAANLVGGGFFGSGRGGFFDHERHHDGCWGRGGDWEGEHDGGEGYGGQSRRLHGFNFGINDNTDFNVNNNVAFEDSGFFKKSKRSFGGGAFDDNKNQNINQNINNNQNLNEDFTRELGGFGGHGGRGDFDEGVGYEPYIESCYGGYGGYGDEYVEGYGGYVDGYGGRGGYGGDFGNGGYGGNDNNNRNLNLDKHTHRFGFGGFGDEGFGGFKAKRDIEKRCDSCARHANANAKSSNANPNANYNYNANINGQGAFRALPASPIVDTMTYIDTAPVVETRPVFETVYQPVVEYETVPIVQALPVVEEVYKPVEVVQPARQQLEIAQPALQQVDIVQPLEVIAPVEVQIAPVVEYQAAFYTSPMCGMPSQPSYSIAPCNGGLNLANAYPKANMNANYALPNGRPNMNINIDTNAASRPNALPYANAMRPNAMRPNTLPCGHDRLY